MGKLPDLGWENLPWDEVVRGVGCPLCEDRADAAPYWSRVLSLGVSTLYLHRDQRFRGYSQLIFNPRHVTGIHELSEPEYTAYMRDLRDVVQALWDVCQPDHMNHLCEGNFVPHLHYNIVPRYQDDVRWRMPMHFGWASKSEFWAAGIYPSEAEHEALRLRLQTRLEKR